MSVPDHSSGRSLLGRRTGVVALSSAYVFSLTYCYVAVIAPSYGYAGFRADALEAVTLVPALLLAVLPALWIPLRLDRPSDLVVLLLYLIAVVPVCLVPVLRGIPGTWTALAYGSLVVLCHGVLRAWLARPPWTGIWVLPLGPTTRSSVIWAGAIGTAVLVIAGLGMPTSLPGLSSVYETRAVLEARLATGGRGLNYALLWLSNAFAPWILAVGLLRRRYVLIVLGLGLEMLVFGTSGFKSVLFTPVLVVAIWVVVERPRLPLGATLLGAAVAGTLFGIAVDALVGAPVVSGLLTRRLILMPGLLSGMYVDFFGANGPAFLTHGLLRGLADPVYGEQPARLVAAAYFPSNPEMYANTNFWADGFANAGWGGPIVVTVALGLVLRVYDALWARRDVRLGTLLLGVPSFTLSNSALLTVLLTHGLGLLCFLSWLWRGQERSSDSANVSGSSR